MCFEENLSWPHEIPYFLKYELEYGLIGNGTLTNYYVYINYIVESLYLFIV